MLLRRCFSIYQVSPRGVYGGTVEFVVAAHGPGTGVAGRGCAPHDAVDVVGPLGRPFPLPKRAGAVRAGRRRLRQRAAVLARRAAARARLPRRLRARRGERGPAVRRRSRPRRAADGVAVTTDDGSLGTRGWVTDVLPDVHPAHRRRRRLRLRPDGDAARRSPRSPPPQGARRAGAPSRSRWPAASGSA